MIARGRSLAILAALALTGAASADQFAPATPPVLSPVPQRIVSLNPCSDAILAEVADPQQIVAISAYSHNPATSSLDPAIAARYPATRGTVEEVLSLRPDLVIDSSFSPPPTVSAYARLGLRLETIEADSNVADALAHVRRLAALVGHADRGEALVRRIEAALASAAPPPGTPPVSAVMWEWGGIVAGDDTLIADIMRRTGFANQAAREGFRQADLYPLERMLAAPPRVILLSGGDRVLHHPALARLGTTVRAELPQGLLFCGGPTIIRAAQRLAQVRRQVTT